MTDPAAATLNTIGPILLGTGIFGGLLIVALAAYGTIVAMRRWWLVISAALLICAGIAYVATSSDLLPPPVPGQPSWAQPDLSAYLGTLLSYIALGVAIRLTTLRLEWRGWTRKWIGDIHIATFLTPVVGAVAIMVWLK